MSPKIIFLIRLVFLTLICREASAQTPRAVPAAYNGDTIKINFVRTWDVMAPVTDSGNLTMAIAPSVARITTTYLDGLGRPLQTVVKKGSMVSGSGPVDMVAAAEYDALGRASFSYLPFAANTAGGNSSISDGLFKLNPFQQQEAFMQQQYGGQGETFFYGQTQFEASLLNRVEKVLSAGDSWAGADRGVGTQYRVNTAADSVRLWSVTDGLSMGDLGSYSSTAAYAAGTLYKNITVDEHAKQVIEFKDKEGKVILKKVQLTASADNGSGSGHWGWLCTYYLYDDRGQLRCVLQPAGVETLSGNNWSLSTPFSILLNEQCFRYEYDQRGRMIVQKVPGALEVYLVYDTRDRLVLRQDGNLRQQEQWLYTTYDPLNRVLSTGLWTSAQPHAMHLFQVYASSAYPFAVDLSTDGQELTYHFYDDYQWVGALLGSDYAWSTTDAGQFAAASNSTWPYPQAVSQSSAVKGLLTGSRARVIGTSQFLYTVSYYDKEGRVVQTHAQNSSGGKDVLTIQYNFSGQVLQTVLRHRKEGTNPQTHLVQTRTTYDTLGRILQIEKKLNSTISSTSIAEGWHVLSTFAYDGLGQLTKKTLAPGYGAGGLDTLANTYNIRGWLTAINKGYITGAANAWFGMELGYDKDGYASFPNKQYNGNISATIWRTRGDGAQRKYDFGYDAANRLLKADFTERHGSNWNTGAGIDFSMKMGNGSDGATAYDANGNIKQLWQRGWKPGGSVTIDSLRYTYNTYSNKLSFVRDGANDPGTRLGDFKESTQNNSDNLNSSMPDYRYDGNGNLTVDSNKAISSISYTHLNLPESMEVSGKGSIKYVYDAAGTKLSKIVRETGKPDKVTLYIGGFVYENDTLQLLQQEEGRIRLTTNTSGVYTGYAFDYFEKDHLGNVRVVLTEQKDTSAYPEASMETGNLGRDSLYYSRVSQTRVDRSTVAGYPTSDMYTSPNDWVARTNGNGHKIGPGILLKVMAGDQFNVRVSSWYKTSGATPGSPVSPLNDLIAALISGLAGAGKFDATALQGGTVLSDQVTSFLTSQTGTSGRPKAYVNWVLLDEQLKYESTGSGFEQVPDESVYGNGGGSPSVHLHQQSGLVAGKSGYLYIYVSNETPNIDVFFDNLQVTHVRGPLVEETHYYPWGLTMAGISSRAINFGGVENRYKYNGYELNDHININWYESFYRSYDFQLGRFCQIDPKPTISETIYSGMANNPIKISDPLGDTLVFPKPSKEFMQTFQSTFNQMIEKQAGGTLVLLLGSKSKVNLVEATGSTISFYDASTKTITWNPTLGITTTNDVSLSPASILNHEADHALNHTEKPGQHFKDATTPNYYYDNNEERRVITGSEQKIAILLGEIQHGQGTRGDHSYKEIFITNNPMSNKGTTIKTNDKKPLIIVPKNNSINK